MDDRRQKNQLVLAFMEEYRGEAPKGLQEGTESSEGKRGTESPAIAEQLMEEVCERENCKWALKRVEGNKGSAGVDGMTVQQLPEHLKQHWPVIREQLLSGTYKPQAVKRVEVPKPDGEVRKLGIPTVLDRFIQEAVMQVLHHRLLNKSIQHRRDAKLAHLSIRLRDFHPLNRLRFIGSAQQLFPDDWPMLLQVLWQLLDGHPIHASASLVAF